MVDWNVVPEVVGKPDFNNLLAVFRREVPSRASLFEFFLNDRLYDRLAPLNDKTTALKYAKERQIVRAYHRAGYDHANVLIPCFQFSTGRDFNSQTVSLNRGGVIVDRDSYKAYKWPDPEKADYAILDALADDLPEGMKLIAYGPCGILENVIGLVGYETLCFLLADDPDLVQDIFDRVGASLVQYYQIISTYPAVGACIDNDDWGFKTQTMFSPRQMRQYVFPWHKRIVDVVHANGKPVLLHSCGHFERILEDIAGIGVEARHSYEDTILPVEEAYERYHDKFAVIGGIDVDFLCRETPENVYDRAKKMLERTRERGGYALGSGNSIPDYVPDKNYFAMIRAALELR